MIYELKLNGPKGYGFLPGALPEHLRYKSYTVVEDNFEPDGGFYEYQSINVPYIKIPTGTLTWKLKFND